MADHSAGKTRQRILVIAGELFVRQGYAGTSIADIAGQLGTSKAALYYHFKSKEEILEALLVEPLAALARLADRAAGERPSPEDLLGALIDLTLSSGPTIATCGNDPSVMWVLKDQARRHALEEKVELILAVLAGDRPSPGRLIRARAALAVAKEATVAVVRTSEGCPGATARAEILAAAMRALGP